MTSKISRRTFLHTAGAASGGLLLPATTRGQTQRSKVQSVIDGRAWAGPGWHNRDLEVSVLNSMLQKGLCHLTATSSCTLAIQKLFPRTNGSFGSVGIKVNCVNPDLPSHPAVVLALVQLLVQAGFHRQNIYVFDRSNHELEKCGFRVNGEETYRCLGVNQEGYCTAPVTVAGAAIRLAKIIERVDHIISLPVLKNHELAGVTLSLKNHFGSIDRPMDLHGRDRRCSPSIAELNTLPQLQQRQRLTVLDATFATAAGGLAAKPEIAPMRLMLGQDPVAVDAIAQKYLNRQRQKKGLPAINAQHIWDAHGLALGTADLNQIDHTIHKLYPVPSKAKPWEVEDSGCGGRPSK